MSRMSSAPFALFLRVVRAPVFGRAYSETPTLFHADLYGILRKLEGEDPKSFVTVFMCLVSFQLTLSKICLLRIAEISRQIGEILSVIRQIDESRDASLFCLLYLSIIPGEAGNQAAFIVWVPQPWIASGEQSSWLTYITARECVSLERYGIGRSAQ